MTSELHCRSCHKEIDRTIQSYFVVTVNREEGKKEFTFCNTECLKMANEDPEKLRAAS